MTCNFNKPDLLKKLHPGVKIKTYQNVAAKPTACGYAVPSVPCQPKRQLPLQTKGPTPRFSMGGVGSSRNACV